jgi:hypothetical protein
MTIDALTIGALADAVLLGAAVAAFHARRPVPRRGPERAGDPQPVRVEVGQPRMRNR